MSLTLHKKMGTYQGRPVVKDQAAVCPNRFSEISGGRTRSQPHRV
ncbi:MAG: hypothetical protein ABWZ25_05550 [Chitinophagaceae bacterium]